MLYGSLEFAYAEPFAEALHAPSFRSWVLGQTKFAPLAEGSVLLADEMRAKRSRVATTWWRSHFRGTCKCAGCLGGQETDLLAIFEATAGVRFAIHFEVKQPTDRFPASKDQAGNYAMRAQCWATSPPKAVLPHADAATVLLCSETKLAEYAPHIAKFGSVITFESIAAVMPEATIG